MKPAAAQAARDIASASGRQANLENLTESIANSTKGQIAGELQALLTGAWSLPSVQHFCDGASCGALTREVAAQQIQQLLASLESMESFEKLTSEQIAGEKLTSEQIAGEKLTIEQIAGESFEKLTSEQIAGIAKEAVTKEQIAGEPQAMQPATEQAASSAQASGGSAKEQIAGEPQATQPTTEQAASSAAKDWRVLTKEQIDSELQALETVAAEAGRDSVLNTIKAIEMMKSSTELTREQKARELHELAMDVQQCKEAVCGKARSLLLKLAFAEQKSLKSRDADFTVYVQTAIKTALGIAHSFMAAFDEDEQEESLLVASTLAQSILSASSARSFPGR